MSKKKHGNYGTFDPEPLDAALKRMKTRKRMTLKSLIARNTIHGYGWYRTIRANRYGEESELKELCRLADIDFKELKFSKIQQKNLVDTNSFVQIELPNDICGKSDRDLVDENKSEEAKDKKFDIQTDQNELNITISINGVSTDCDEIIISIKKDCSKQPKNDTSIIAKK